MYVERTKFTPGGYTFSVFSPQHSLVSSRGFERHVLVSRVIIRHSARYKVSHLPQRLISTRAKLHTRVPLESHILGGSKVTVSPVFIYYAQQSTCVFMATNIWRIISIAFCLCGGTLVGRFEELDLLDAIIFVRVEVEADAWTMLLIEVRIPGGACAFV